jgi:hypothetical protein
MAILPLCVCTTVHRRSSLFYTRDGKGFWSIGIRHRSFALGLGSLTAFQLSNHFFRTVRNYRTHVRGV